MRKPRGAYRHTVETSIYLTPTATSRGIGMELYSALVGVMAETDVHRLIAGISLPNAASR